MRKNLIRHRQSSRSHKSLILRMHDVLTNDSGFFLRKATKLGVQGRKIAPAANPEA